jgi:hypothetical protein
MALTKAGMVSRISEVLGLEKTKSTESIEKLLR